MSLKSPPHAALCWEYGAGLGHIATLKTIAFGLRSAGWKTTLAGPIQAMDFVSQSFDRFEPVPGPKDVGIALQEPPGEKVASFKHAVWDFGFHSSRYVFTRLQLWRQLFEKIKPDLVIADYSPNPLIAAKGRIPTIATGNGYSLPPTDLKKFPRYHKVPDFIEESSLLASINEGISLAGGKNIKHLPQIFDADFLACITLEILDPYHLVRSQPVLGPLFMGAIPKCNLIAKQNVIFTYLTHCKPDVLRAVTEALVKLERPVDLFSLQQDEIDTRLVAGSQVRILNSPVPLARIISDYGLVVHLGGHMMLTEMLVAGMPQVLLTIDIEKVLFATQLARKNLAVVHRIDRDYDTSAIAETITSAFQGDLRSHAQQFSNLHPSECHTAALNQIIDNAKALVS